MHRKMKIHTTVLCALSAIPASDSFAPLPQRQLSEKADSASLSAHDNKEETRISSGFSNPLTSVMDMFRNLDDVIDDFYNKRMGNGETFYGKRKFNPSGKVEGEYNGMGISDKMKIDTARDRKEEWLEEKKMRQEIAELRRAKEARE